ncbi:hypothetical protein D9758_002632 [Tetrapyrgos nigripes]|uniref:Uncharacterized protein n=1 Tax=Tetrapyrgos nigripes TaxID=182062 RepID=A0A8H5GQ92_9AGAR|nr:hypothetical protein D9758_002632 [Tetrapyrgos nigripes]
MSEPRPEDIEDILSDSLSFLGGKPVVDQEIISYGPLRLSVAAKEGKANTLLADHLFSPSLFLAERIERGLLPVHRKTVIELGAGCALPSLLMSTITESPSLILVTDYPDDSILNNLKANVERNASLTSPECHVSWMGYEWGTDTTSLLKLLPAGSSEAGYDVVILSDLLHFHSSHDSIIESMKLLLSKGPESICYLSAGKYTLPHVCDNFVLKAKVNGFDIEEIITDEKEKWKGHLEVSGLDNEALSTRKAACRFWIARWK